MKAEQERALCLDEKTKLVQKIQQDGIEQGGKQKAEAAAFEAIQEQKQA